MKMMNISDFCNGYAIVELDGKYNFKDKDGNTVSEKWYDEVYNFNENGYAIIQNKGKFNLIDKSGKIISKKWFDDVYDFCNDYAIVELDGKYNFIGTNGKPISEKWFDEITHFNKNGYAKVRLDRKWNFIDKNSKPVSEKWFDDVYDFNNDFGKVQLDEKYNFIDKTGKLISEEWFNKVIEFSDDGYAAIELNGKWNFINKNGKPISEKWFDDVSNFNNNSYARVKLDGEWDVIDIKNIKNISPKNQTESRNVVELSGMVVSCKVNNSEDEGKAFVHLELCTSSGTERNEKGQTVLKNPMYHRVMTAVDKPVPERILKLQQKLEDDVKKWMTGMMEQNQPTYLSVKGVLVSNLMKKDIDPYVLAKPEDIRITDKPVMKNSVKLEGQIVDTFTNPIYATMVIKSQTPNGLDTYIEVNLKEQDNMKRYNDICRGKVKKGDTVSIKGMLKSQHQSTGKGITFSCKVGTNNFTNKTQARKQKNDKGVRI